MIPVIFVYLVVLLVCTSIIYIYHTYMQCELILILGIGRPGSTGDTQSIQFVNIITQFTYDRVLNPLSRLSSMNAIYEH